MADADDVKIRRKRPRKSSDDLPETPDPVDIAMHALATGADQHGVARAVLEKHARLIDIQCKREREELENVRVQRITRWLILSAVAGLLLAIIGGIYTAVGSEALAKYEAALKLAPNWAELRRARAALGGQNHG